MNNRISFYKYYFKLNKEESITLLIDFALFLLSLKVFLKFLNDSTNVLSLNWAVVSVLIGTLCKFIYDTYLIIDKISKYNKISFGDISEIKIDMTELQVSVLEKQNGFEMYTIDNTPTKKDYVTRSHNLNQLLQSKEITGVRNKIMETNLKKYLNTEKHHLIPFLQKQYREAQFQGKKFFNESKLCLSNDFSVKKTNELTSKQTNKLHVAVHKGYYYDTFLTNIISGRKFMSNDNDSTIFNLVDQFPIEVAQNQTFLKPISLSMMNNEIGVSTIGITKDMFLVLWKQNRKAQSSQGMVVPTGSGSCDWSDLIKCDLNTYDFKKTIESAMQRELWEESAKTSIRLAAHEVGDTKMLGFFRWATKGGKPEFVGVTKLNLDYIELSSNNHEVYNHSVFEVQDLDTLDRVIKELLRESDNISTPLHQNLLTLSEVINSEDSVFKEELITFLGY